MRHAGAIGDRWQAPIAIAGIDLRIRRVASLYALIVFLMALVVVMLAWRQADRRAEDAAWRGLTASVEPAADCFDPRTVESLPEPARRYFRFAIRPGTPLYRIVEIEMGGELGLGPAENPGYRPMAARQLLSAPHGLVWKLRSGPISGSDGLTPNHSWTRFWLSGLLPIVRAGGDPDHRLSAFGRVAAESAIWSPAVLLPGGPARWDFVDDSTARFTMSLGELEQSVLVVIDADGRPSRVVMQRWSNANAEKVFRRQPFGGELSEFRDFDGYRLPTRVIAGNHYGTGDYFPFFKADVTSIRFPEKSAAAATAG